VVGFGTKCGDIRLVVACPELHEKHLIHQVCHRLQCPVCFRDAASRAAHRIEERLEGLHGAYEKNGIRLGRPKHIVFSPPQEDWAQERLERDGGKALRRRLYQLLVKYAKDGVYGGATITHGERRKHTDGTECDKKRCRRKHVWVWGPHIHFIGYGFFENSARFYTETGWTYKRIDDGGGERDIFSTAKYLLTHCALFVGEDREQLGTAYHMMGVMANCKGGGRVLEKHEEPVLCETCKKELHQYRPVGQEPNLDTDSGEYMVWRSVVEWYVNKRTKKYIQVLLEGVDAEAPPPRGTVRVPERGYPLPNPLD
jgi:hypothetical protein